jgi:hypothetical protein
MASGANPEQRTVGGGRVAANSTRPLTWRDIRGTIRRHADELICTEAEAATLEALRAATGETDGDMERHTMRQYLIAERIADTRRIPYDRELLLCACFLHDSGLYGPASTGDVYIKDSARCRRFRRPSLAAPHALREQHALVAAVLHGGRLRRGRGDRGR